MNSSKAPTCGWWCCAGSCSDGTEQKQEKKMENQSPEIHDQLVYVDSQQVVHTEIEQPQPAIVGGAMVGDGDVITNTRIQVQEMDGSSNIIQSCSDHLKSRLQWTQELHEKFVKAVNELGGANRATPRGILRLMMDVEGLTMNHLKSHLQKFRLGKTRRMYKKPFILGDYLTLAGQGSSSSRTLDNNIGVPYECQMKTVREQAYRNLQLAPVEPQSTQQNLDLGKDFASDSGHQQAPALLPLFPTQRLNMLQGPAKQVAPDQPTNDTSLAVDEFLNALGCSSKLAVNNAQETSRASANCGSFMDDLANF
ncbi:unnamed protein product [Fraxinus pennsylvanica]|uniref:HTH myb-type domain-containing protein n=1 Tax=Fraxinus pennsylvanica TaxID=56036 RepID=A0AAD2DM31_9LAMI|nr:unnamed protein product [Fraxinus pennsylvanica]